MSAVRWPWPTGRPGGRTLDLSVPGGDCSRRCCSRPPGLSGLRAPARRAGCPPGDPPPTPDLPGAHGAAERRAVRSSPRATRRCCSTRRQTGTSSWPSWAGRTASMTAAARSEVAEGDRLRAVHSKPSSKDGSCISRARRIWPSWGFRGRARPPRPEPPGASIRPLRRQPAERARALPRLARGQARPRRTGDLRPPGLSAGGHAELATSPGAAARSRTTCAAGRCSWRGQGGPGRMEPSCPCSPSSGWTPWRPRSARSRKP